MTEDNAVDDVKTPIVEGEAGEQLDTTQEGSEAPESSDEVTDDVEETEEAPIVPGGEDNLEKEVAEEAPVE